MSNMRQFRYTGPNSAITLIVLDKEQTPKDLDVILWHDSIVELPEEHEAVQVLLHQGLLEAIEQTQSAPAESAEPAESAQVAETPTKTKGKA